MFVFTVVVVDIYGVVDVVVSHTVIDVVNIDGGGVAVVDAAIVVCCIAAIAVDVAINVPRDVAAAVYGGKFRGYAEDMNVFAVRVVVTVDAADGVVA